MKALFIATALVCSTAHAGVIATSPTNRGGAIALTDIQDACPAGTKGYGITDFAGQNLMDFGCWTTNGGFISWQSMQSGFSGNWDVNGFEFTPYGKAKIEERKKRNSM